MGPLKLLRPIAAMIVLGFVLSLKLPIQAQSVTWLPTMGPRGGEAEVLVSSSGALLLKVATGWLRSQDEGESWTPLPDAPNNLWAAPNGTLWGGRDDNHGNDNPDNGVFRSDDDGLTWISIGLDSHPAHTVRQQRNGTLWVRADSLFSSTDGGTSWHVAEQGLDSLWCPVGFLELTSRDDVYIGTNGCLGFGYGSQLARWDSTQTRWRAIDKDPEALIGGRFTDLLVSPEGVLWATARDIYTQSDGGLYRAPADSLLQRIGWGSHLSLARDGHLLAGTPEGLLQSPDDGATWTPAGLSGLAVSSLALSPDGTRYAGTTGYCYPIFDPPQRCVPGFGAYAQQALDTMWTPLELGQPTARVIALAAEAAGLWALSENGLWRTEDGGASWKAVDVDPTTEPFWRYGEPMKLHVSAWGALYATGTWEQILYRFHPEEQRWEPIGPPTRYSSFTLDVVSVSPRTLLVAANDVVYRSEDEGVTWTTVLEQGTRALLRVPDGTLFAGGIGLWRSEDDGQTWSGVEEAPSPVIQLAAASAETLFAATHERVYRSTDGGASWRERGAHPGPKTGLYDLLVGREGHLFGRTWGRGRDRAFASWDGGLTWIPLTEGLPGSIEISSLTIGSGGHVYAGTRGYGAVRSALPVIVARHPDAVPTPASALLVFPNPTTGPAWVRFTLSQPAAVRLAVYDVLGRHVKELVKGSYPGGTHTVHLDVTSLPAGLYVVQLSTDNLVQSTRFVSTP